MPLHTYSRIVHLADTDATGNIFFARVFDFALETLESFLAEKNFSLNFFLQNSSFLFPVVHSSADYFSRISIGDNIIVHMDIPRIGDSSITFAYQLLKGEVLEKCVKISMVHAAVDRLENQSVPLPDNFKAKFLRTA